MISDEEIADIEDDVKAGEHLRELDALRLLTAYRELKAENELLQKKIAMWRLVGGAND